MSTNVTNVTELTELKRRKLAGGIKIIEQDLGVHRNLLIVEGGYGRLSLVLWLICAHPLDVSLP